MRARVCVMCVARIPRAVVNKTLSSLRGQQESHTVEGTLSRSMHNIAEAVAKPVDSGDREDRGGTADRGATPQPLPEFCKGAYPAQELSVSCHSFLIHPTQRLFFGAGMAVVLVGCTGTVRDTLYAADMAARTKPALKPLLVASAAAHWRGTHTCSLSTDSPIQTE